MEENVLLSQCTFISVLHVQASGVTSQPLAHMQKIYITAPLCCDIKILKFLLKIS